MRRVVGVVSICSGILAVSVSLAAAQPPPTALKNLKVIPKTWTTQQVRAVMQTFAESLGVQCSHCHSADPNAPPPAAGNGAVLDYALDDKPEMDVSRKMMLMVMAINADNLKGIGDAAVPEKVTCFTCHAGAKTPPKQPAAGWGRGNFSLLPAGPTLPARRGGN